MMRKILFEIIGLFVLCGTVLGLVLFYKSFQSALSNEPTEAATPIDSELKEIQEEKWKNTKAEEFLKISELKNKNPQKGVYEMEGFVVNNSYSCPCLNETNLLMWCRCKPPTITISEKNVPGNSQRSVDALENYEIVIETNLAPETFPKGRKFRFKVEIPERRDDSKPLTQVRLVAFQEYSSRKDKSNEN